MNSVTPLNALFKDAKTKSSLHYDPRKTKPQRGWRKNPICLEILTLLTGTRIEAPTKKFQKVPREFSVLPYFQGPRRSAEERAEIQKLRREQLLDDRYGFYRKRESRPRYQQYINSLEWKYFRDLIFAKRGRKCEKCRTTHGVFQVHHLTYDRLGCEKPSDVMVLCSDCHKGIHT